MSTEQHPPSPCNDVCIMDPESGYCRGCLRTIEEIVEWPVLDAEEKRRILEKVRQRVGRVSRPGE